MPQKRFKPTTIAHERSALTSCGSTRALHVCKITIGRGLRRAEDEPRVEDVERLVLHGTHVEVVDGHDVEEVEVVLQPVPAQTVTLT